MPVPPSFDARLVSARAISHSVRELTFERTDGVPFGFEAGQWVSLVLPLGDQEARRAYSIASGPDGSARFQIAVTHVVNGPGSSHLHAMAPDTTVRIIGPQGFFTRGKGAGHPALFIGTGTGVTPLRSMMQAALKTGETSPMWLLFGVRGDEDRIYADEFDAMARANPHVHVEYTLSRGTATWAGRRGYVQTHLKELWQELATRGTPHAYVCGLQRMVGSVRDLLRKDLNIPREQVHSERYD